MNLDELKNEWNARDAKLDQAIALNTARLRSLFLSTNTAPRAWPIHPVGLAVTLLLLAWLGNFLGDHYTEPRFFLPALGLEIWTIVVTVVTAVQRQAVRELDYGLSVLTLQHRLETLRVRRLRSFTWSFLTGQLLWSTPLLIVLCKGLFGVDLIATSPQFVVGSLMFGVACIPVGLALARLLAGHVHSTVVDSLAGRDLRAARDYLARLERFDAGMPA